jgi:hypothetical protein
MSSPGSAPESKKKRKNFSTTPPKEKQQEKNQGRRRSIKKGRTTLTAPIPGSLTPGAIDTIDQVARGSPSNNNSSNDEMDNKDTDVENSYDSDETPLNKISEEAPLRQMLADMIKNQEVMMTRQNDQQKALMTQQEKNLRATFKKEMNSQTHNMRQNFHTFKKELLERMDSQEDSLQFQAERTDLVEKNVESIQRKAVLADKDIRVNKAAAAAATREVHERITSMGMDMRGQIKSLQDQVSTASASYKSVITCPPP